METYRWILYLLRVNETLIEWKQESSLDQSRDNNLLFSSLAETGEPIALKYEIYYLRSKMMSKYP